MPLKEALFIFYLQNKDRFKQGWLDIRRNLKKGQTVIVIFGPGGVGKSILGACLAPDFKPKNLPQGYQRSPGIEDTYLSIDPSQSIRIAPGQKDYLDQHWPSLFSDIDHAKKNVIVIFVTCYGYHKPLNDSKITNWESYISQNRETELEYLKFVVERLKTSEIPDLQFLTVITKQDLWWDKNKEVIDYYKETTGKYEQLINSLRSRKGAQNFGHEVCYFAARRENLTDSDPNNIGTKTVAGYEDVTQYNSDEHLTRVLKSYLNPQTRKSQAKK